MVAQLYRARDTAEKWYRKALAIREALKDYPRMAASYHQLGTLAQDRGHLAAAEQWYRKALAIEKVLTDRPSLAMTYGQLGLLTEQRGDVAAALDWTVRCVALFEKFPHPATGVGPHHLVRLAGMLGLPALEASWQRCTGVALPPAVAQVVAERLKDSSP